MLFSFYNGMSYQHMHYIHETVFGTCVEGTTQAALAD